MKNARIDRYVCVTAVQIHLNLCFSAISRSDEYNYDIIQYTTNSTILLILRFQKWRI